MTAKATCSYSACWTTYFAVTNLFLLHSMISIVYLILFDDLLHASRLPRQHRLLLVPRWCRKLIFEIDETNFGSYLFNSCRDQSTVPTRHCSPLRHEPLRRNRPTCWFHSRICYAGPYYHRKDPIWRQHCGSSHQTARFQFLRSQSCRKLNQSFTPDRCVFGFINLKRSLITELAHF